MNEKRVWLPSQPALVFYGKTRNHAFSTPLFLLLVPLFKPEIVGQIPVVSTVFKMWQIISLFILFIYLVNVADSIRDVIPCLFLALFSFFYSIVCVATHTGVVSALSKMITATIVASLFLVRGKEGRVIIDTVCLLFEIWLALHFLSIITTKLWGLQIASHYNDMYYLGQDNYSAFATIPMVTVLLWRDLRFHKRIGMRSAALLALMTLSYLVLFSVAAAMAYLFLCLNLVISYSNDPNKVVWGVLDSRLVIVFAITLFALIYFLGAQNVFFDLFGDVFDKKGATLNSRTEIWSQVGALVRMSPLSGNGASNAVMGSHAHNLVLEYLFRSGLIGSLLMAAFVIMPYTKKYQICDRANCVLRIGVAAVFVAGFFDFYLLLPYFYCLVCLLYCDKDIAIELQ